MTVNPNVEAYVSADLIDAGGDVSIGTQAVANVTAYTTNFGIGGVAAGEVDATANVGATSKAYVSPSVEIHAGGSFSLTSDSNITTDTHANADSVGLGAGADAETDSNVTNLTQSMVGANAIIDAGTADIDATVSKLKTKASSKALAGGFVAVAIADANIDTESTAEALIKAGAQITGRNGVDIGAFTTNADADTDRTAIADRLHSHPHLARRQRHGPHHQGGCRRRRDHLRGPTRQRHYRPGYPQRLQSSGLAGRGDQFQRHRYR